jgi:signal peptidase
MNKISVKLVLKTIKESVELFLLFLLLTYAFISIVFPNQFLEIAGFDSAVVQTSSMQPTIKRYELIFMKKINDDLKVGDIIVFYDDSHTHLIVHRIVAINVVGGKAYYTTRGDNNLLADAGTRTMEDIYAEYAYTVPFLGLVITFVKTPLGICALFLNLITVVGIIILWRCEVKDDLNIK